MSDKAMLKVRVNPRSSRNQVTGYQNGVLSIKITAPPVEGAANKFVIAYLSDLLHVKKAQISLASGATGRDKVFQIDGLSPDELLERVSDLNP